MAKLPIFLTAAAATMLSAGVLASDVEAATHKKMEKCYGIAEAGSNDCGARGHSCAGQSKVDGDGQEWVFLPKGICERIVNGSLEPFDQEENDSAS